MPAGGDGPPAKRPKVAAPPPPRPAAQPSSSAQPSSPAPRRHPPPVDSQRRALPIFQARGPLLSQLRGLDSAVLIGECGSPAAGSLRRFGEVAPRSGCSQRGSGPVLPGGGGRCGL